MNGIERLVSSAIGLVQQSHYTVALTGAGISTPSGIPDFRSPTSGIWQNVDPMQVASIYAFKHNPRPFYQWFHPLTKTVLAAEPNIAHLALAQMEQADKLRAIITQNIDLLHSKAGSKIIYEVHGHMREATCLECKQVFAAQDVMQSYIETGALPLCPTCQGILKPNVILYGELLPFNILHNAQKEAKQCDLMIVLGSSLEVSPVNELPVLAKQAGARLIIINLTETHLDYLADVVIHADVVDILPRLAAAIDHHGV